MNNLPTKQGERVYAKENEIGVYQSASNASRYTKIKHRFDTPVFNSGDFIGNYTGIKSVADGETWYQVNWEHTWRNHGFLGIKRELGRENLKGYVKETEITVVSEAIAGDAKSAATKKQVEDVLNGGLNTATTGSGSTTTSSNFLVWVLAGITVLLLGVVILVRNFNAKKKKNSGNLLTKNDLDNPTNPNKIGNAKQ